MRSLCPSPTLSSLHIVATPRTVHLPPIAVPAEKEHPPAVIQTTLNLPQIVHSRGSTARNSTTAVDSCDNPVVERVHSRRPWARR